MDGVLSLVTFSHLVINNFNTTLATFVLGIYSGLFICKV